ncbi:MAG TPA: dicarboxylate/amino acid:cation symporter, partial [Thermoanaerobaculia bacterium]|nr:dicarboxylate/amino acid:cation symporter [Thermoanaerobaculia bacterium]
MKRTRLHWLIFFGIAAGVVWGTWLNGAYLDTFESQARVEVLGESWTPEQETLASKQIQQAVDRRFRDTLWGGAAYGLASLFLALLKMVVIPLVVSSLITGVVGMGDFRRLGKVGGKTAAWYLTTSLLAILTGLLFVNLIGPGRGVVLSLPVAGEVSLAAPDSPWDFLVAIVPENVVAAAAGFDLVAVIFFSLLFGIFLLQAEAAIRAPVEAFFRGVFAVMMRMTMWVIALAPVGIAALIARLIATTGPQVFVNLAGYAATVALALAVHFLVTLPLLFWLVTRRNPYLVMRAMSPALLTAFSTASSSGTLPVTLERVENGVGVSNRVSSFVLPLGATVNMDGTALYECVATLFVAQLYATANPDFTLTFGAQLTVVALALLVSIGAAGIPHAGLVMMVIIFQAVGLPVGLTALLWA